MACSFNCSVYICLLNGTMKPLLKPSCEMAENTNEALSMIILFCLIKQFASVNYHLVVVKKFLPEIDCLFL